MPAASTTNPRSSSLRGVRARSANIWLHSTLVFVGVGASACVDSDPQLGVIASQATVADYTTSTCSTSVVVGLSKQIAKEADCAKPGSFVQFAPGNGLTFSSNAVLPFLEKKAKDDLMAVAANSPIQLNSALRTVVQQYLLYRWYQQGRCGITIAATPGNSNHEGGRAVDVANYSTRITALANKGWAHDVAGDPVHFDHLSSPDGRGQDVAAFQRLWNRNHPNDTIAVDGDYGPQTEAKLRASPATGFPLGPSCENRSLDLDVLSIAGPDFAAPDTRIGYTFVLVNSGQTAWPDTTKLQISTGSSSDIYDEAWESQTVVTEIGQMVPPDGQLTLAFTIKTPAVTDETPISQVFELENAGTKFGSINLALTVKPGLTGEESGDGNEEGDVNGGCNAGGGGLGWLGFALPLVVLRRRRR
jgi:hypothetical protein